MKGIFTVLLVAAGVASAGGVRASFPAYDTIVYANSDSPESQTYEKLEFDLDTLKQVVTIDPGAARVLLVFHSAFQGQRAGVRLEEGMVAISGIPTELTLDLAFIGADEKSIQKSMEPLDPGTYLQVHWEAVEIDSDTLQVTFVSELMTESKLQIPQAVTYPKTLVLVSQTGHRVLSVSHE